MIVVVITALHLDVLKRQYQVLGVGSNRPNESITVVTSVACETALDSGCNLKYNENDDGTKSIKLGCGFFGMYSCKGGC